MKKGLSSVICLIIVIIVAAGVFLWSQNRSDEEILKGLEPEEFDVSATCRDITDHTLLCNEGNDEYLFLDDVRVYLQKSETAINENGDEETKVSYSTYSLTEIERDIKENGEVSIALWLTQTGKVEVIMVMEKSLDNRNASLVNLEGLDPAGYSSANVILNMDKQAVNLAPIHYSPEEKDKFASLTNDYSFADEVGYYTQTVTITVDLDGTRHRNIQYGKTTFEDLQANLKEGQKAYIWYNEYGNVDAVMTYNEKIVLKEEKSK